MQTEAYVPSYIPLITPQAPAEDQERVNALFERVRERLGFIPDGLRLYSFSPPLLETFLSHISYFNGGGTGLPTELTAMIRYLISWQTGCGFCIDMNEALLVQLGKDLESIRAARTNPDMAPLSDRDKALLRLALKACNSPEFVNQHDLDQARRHGWQDRDLFDCVVQAASIRAFNTVLRTFKIEHQGAYA